MPGIHGFDHMVIRLEDFDAGLAAYTKLFPAGPRALPKQTLESGLKMGLNMAYFDLPNGGFLEIVAPTGPNSVLRPALDKSGPGMNLIAFQCDDLAATVKMMKDNGVRVIRDELSGMVKIHPKSTHGILMQLVEKSPNATKAIKPSGQVPDTSGTLIRSYGPV